MSWALALPILAYAPYSLQRRLPDGVWVALVVLAMAGLEKFDLSQGISVFRRWSKASLFLAFPSTIILVFGAFQAVRIPSMPVFRPAAEVNAFLQLNDLAQTNQVVLAAYQTGNALPAWSPVRVITGQRPESMNYVELNPRVAQFFQTDTPDAVRQELLREFNVRFVFWGPMERTLGAWDPHQAAYLSPAFESEDYAIFSVR